MNLSFLSAISLCCEKESKIKHSGHSHMYLLDARFYSCNSFVSKLTFDATFCSDL
jgi:hypothetical protein